MASRAAIARFRLARSAVAGSVPGSACAREAMPAASGSMAAVVARLLTKALTHAAATRSAATTMAGDRPATESIAPTKRALRPCRSSAQPSVAPPANRKMTWSA